MDYIQERFVRIDKLEAAFTKHIRLALLRELEVLIVLVEAGATSELVAAHVWSKTLKTVLDAMYLQVIQQEAKHEYLRLVGERKATPALPVAEWLRLARNFIAVESSKAIVAITATTRNEVKKVLKQATGAGKSIAETAKDMRTSITTFSNIRAKRIARTELVGAANFGSYCGAATTGLALDKLWLATGDGRTRESHNDANGQRVDINGLFTVGGNQCRFPADPALSARERVNCRCTIIYKPKPKTVQGAFDF